MGCTKAGDSSDAGNLSGFDAQVIDAPITSFPDASGGEDAGAILDGGADAALSCSLGTCDPTVALSCGADTSCTIIADAPECLGGGVADEGQACTSSTDCRDGLACFQRYGAVVGLCQRICCDGVAETCRGDELCIGPGILGDGTHTTWHFCLGARECDVLSQPGTCEPSEGCYILDGDGAHDCRPAGSLGLDDACTAPTDCAPGFFCGGLIEQRCARICSLEAGCPEGEGDCMAYRHSPPGTGICTR